MSKNLNFKLLKENELFWWEEVVYCIASCMPFTSFTLLGALKYCSLLLLIYYNYRCFWFMFRGILLQRIKVLEVEIACGTTHGAAVKQDGNHLSKYWQCLFQSIKKKMHWNWVSRFLENKCSILAPGVTKLLRCLHKGDFAKDSSNGFF